MAMSPKTRSTVFLALLLVAYISVAVIMWVPAFGLSADKSRAAMAGAASAFSVGGARGARSCVQCFPQQRLTGGAGSQRKSKRGFAGLLTAIRDFELACDEVKFYRRTTT